MRILKLPHKDPRTVSRDIPGISEVIFPSLIPGLVAYLNRTSISLPGLSSISELAIEQSKLAKAMLFEISYVMAEKILRNEKYEIDDCIGEAIKRQSRFFDATPPKEVTANDLKLIEMTATNLCHGLSYMTEGNEIVIAPVIPGLGWISSGVGDFAFSDTLVEVKCSNKNFSASDYRQLLFYWLLQYASVIRTQERTWTTGILFNPRRNCMVEVDLQHLYSLVANEKNVVEAIEMLESLMSPRRRAEF